MDAILQLIAYFRSWWNRPMPVVPIEPAPVVLPPIAPVPEPAPPIVVTPTPAPLPVVTPQPIPAPKPTPVPVSPLLFDTAQNARHSVRVLCDNSGLSIVPDVEIEGRLYLAKDVICACIEQESNFNNAAINQNKNTAGKVLSTDWGLCQINDFYHIGPGKDFPSVDYVVENPGAAVQFMIDCYKAGELKLWVSYSSGAYRAFLPQSMAIRSTLKK